MLHLVKFVSHLTMLIEKYFVSPSGVVLVQCIQLIIFVTLRQCYTLEHVWFYGKIGAYTKAITL